MILPVNRHALHQIGDRLKIPRKFAERLAQDHPDMLAYNVNCLFNREPENRMVRTLDGRVRAFMSDRYRIMDNHDLAEAVLPHLIQFGAQIESCEITESRMYIKAIRPDLKAEIPPPPNVEMGKGHTFFVEKVQGGICLSNSEIGAGRLSVQPAVYTLRCTNLAVFQDTSFNKYHLGGRIKGAEGLWELFSDRTKETSDRALWMQVNDLVKSAMDGTMLQQQVEKLMAARRDEIQGDPVKTVEVFADKKGLNDNEKSGVLQHLIRGGELTRYGLHAAVTRHSAEVEDYDRASELERLGGQVIELPRSDWEVINVAKAA